MLKTHIFLFTFFFCRMVSAKANLAEARADCASMSLSNCPAGLISVRMPPKPLRLRGQWQTMASLGWMHSMTGLRYVRKQETSSLKCTSVSTCLHLKAQANTLTVPKLTSPLEWEPLEIWRSHQGRPQWQGKWGNCPRPKILTSPRFCLALNYLAGASIFFLPKPWTKLYLILA